MSIILITNYVTRLLTLPKPKREFLKRSFKFSGAMVSNEAKLTESIS